MPYTNKRQEIGTPIQPHPTDDNPVNSDNTSPRTRKELVFAGVVIVLSFLLLLGVVALQITAIYFASRGLQVQNFKVSWCSPAFYLPGSSNPVVEDVNCNQMQIHINYTQGVGCIDLPGTRQQQWLIGTMAIVIASLIFQTIDFILLVLVNVDHKTFSGVKLKRPWFSIFIGLALMLTVAGMSGIHSMSLPQEINKTVFVPTNDNSPLFCKITLVPEGLRGSILGWTDGVFGSWGTIYFGSSTHDQLNITST